MKKKLLVGVLITLIIVCTVKAYATPWFVVDALRNKNISNVDSQLKLLGFERGANGLSKLQVLVPNSPELNNVHFLLAVSWEGPYEGHLALIDSNGKVISRENVGWIKSICLRTLREGGDDILIVDSIRGSGSGVREDRFDMFALTQKGFSEIWNELSYYKSFPLGMAPQDNYEIQGSISFEDLNGDGVYELLYTSKKIHYNYDTKVNKANRDGVSKASAKLFKLSNNKYKFLEEMKGN